MSIQQREFIWGRLSKTDIVVSLVGASMPLLSGFLEGIPWTYRIPAAVLTGCGVLWAWRHLTLRRLLMPAALLKSYEDDLLSVGELFNGRATISNVTFRRTEFKGPGAIYLEPNCRLARPLFNPSFDMLVIVPQNGGSLQPFFRFRNCVFDDCVFTGVGILIDPNNSLVFGIAPPPQQRPNAQIPQPPDAAESSVALQPTPVPATSEKPPEGAP